MTNAPYERQACISRSIILESVDNLIFGLSELSLDREHSGEDEYATHQTDNIVHDRSGTAQLHCSLVALHECGIRQKRSKSSTYQDEIRWLLHNMHFSYHPWSWLVCEINAKSLLHMLPENSST